MWTSRKKTKLRYRYCDTHRSRTGSAAELETNKKQDETFIRRCNHAGACTHMHIGAHAHAIIYDRTHEIQYTDYTTNNGNCSLTVTQHS